MRLTIYLLELLERVARDARRAIIRNEIRRMKRQVERATRMPYEEFKQMATDLGLYRPE